jgi:flagellar motor switch protein FliN
MKTNEETQYIYEPKFEQLKEGEKEVINAVEAISQAKMELEVEVGFTHQKIDKIVNLKVGDVLRLEKTLEEPLDINVNGVNIASGESMIMHDKIAVRLSKIKSMQEED